MFIYIIAIAWVYVVFLMSITESSLTAGIMTFLFYCVLPLSLFLYLLRTPQRKKSRQTASKVLSPIQLSATEHTNIVNDTQTGKND